MKEKVQKSTLKEILVSKYILAYVLSLILISSKLSKTPVKTVSNEREENSPLIKFNNLHLLKKNT